MDDDKCPIDFNFEPSTFAVGDSVSYRIPGRFRDFPFAGVLMEVHEAYVVLTSTPNDPKSLMRATLESRPIVADEDVR